MKAFLRLLLTFMLLLCSVAVIVIGFYFLSTPSGDGMKTEPDPVEVTATETLEQSPLTDVAGVSSSGGTVTGD